MQQNLLTVNQASKWATTHLQKPVSPSNISYLIQYGRVPKIVKNGTTHVSQKDLHRYYKSYAGAREVNWKEKLGDDVNWELSFDHLREKDTTKHVHRLHPYKGKFIPQLVAYFLDQHTDEFKKEAYFQPNDIILDPFCGSGTALVQANELGIHAIGIDVSAFNAMITNVKVGSFDLSDLENEINRITNALLYFEPSANAREFEARLLDELAQFNKDYFPSPEYRRKIRTGEINFKKYGPQKEREFLPIYQELLSQYHVQLQQDGNENFLDKWYLRPIRDEIDFVFELVTQIENPQTKKIIAVILSRTMRSCRATTHADLATLVDPISATYYCHKHGKICKPLFSMLSWWRRYSKDTMKRLMTFDGLKTDTHQICLTGDSRVVDIFDSLSRKQPKLAKLAREKKIKGIFSSPPYVGLINYHQQHAYSYDLFGFERRDSLEIGPLFRGKGKAARESYIQGVADVLRNSRQYLADDYDVFLVANDKFNMYPRIAELSNMTIVNRYRRPVLNRTERDRSAYAETTFHLKEAS